MVGIKVAFALSDLCTMSSDSIFQVMNTQTGTEWLELAGVHKYLTPLPVYTSSIHVKQIGLQGVSWSF